ncbi:MAG: zinc-ribbon domain-containing protein [Bryobacteraceae bacterium]
MFCHTCGTQVADGTQFCPNCGQPLSGAPIGAPRPAVPWTPPTSVTIQTGRWIDAGWQMVKADLGNFILIALVFALVNALGLLGSAARGSRSADTACSPRNRVNRALN